MDYNVKDNFPEQFKKEGSDNEKMLNVTQYWIEQDYDLTTLLAKTIDYLTADEKYLNLMLIEEDWNFSFELTVILKRKIIAQAQNFRDKSGFTGGIVEMVLFLTGHTIIFETPNESFFKIDRVSMIRDGKSIGSLQGDFVYIIKYPSAMTAEEIAIMEEIVDFMALLQFTFIYIAV